MRYLRLDALPGTGQVPGAFLDTVIEGDSVTCACCFVSFLLADRRGTYYPAADDRGERYEVLIPEFTGLQEGVTVIAGMYERGVTTKVKRVE